MKDYESISVEGNLGYRIKNGEVTILKVIDDTLTDIEIPEMIEGFPVTIIDDEAFASCYFLGSLKIPNTIKKIGCRAFAGCKALECFELGENVKEIGAGAFFVCEQINITISPHNRVFEIIDGALYNKVEKTLHTYFCSNEVKEFHVPNTTKKLENWAFSYNISLEKLIIPDSVTQICEDSFVISNLNELILPKPLIEKCNFFVPKGCAIR